MSQEILSRIAGWCDAEPDLELEGTTLRVTGDPPLDLSLEIDEEAVALAHLHAVEEPPQGFTDAAVGLLSRRGSMVRGEVVTGSNGTEARIRYPIYLEGLNRQSFLVAVRETAAAVDDLDLLAAGGPADAEESAGAPKAGASESASPPPSESGQSAHTEPARAAAAAESAVAWSPTHVVPASGMAAWSQPDPAQQPVANLAPGVQLRIDEQRGAWARVTGSNGWQGWVDARILQPMGAVTAAAPAAAQPGPRGAGSAAGFSVHSPTALFGGIAMIVATFLAWGDWTYAKALDVGIAAVYPLSEWVTWDQPKIGMLLLAAGVLAIVAAVVPGVKPGLRVLAGLVAVIMSAGVLLSYAIVVGVPFGDLFDHHLTGVFVALVGGIVAMVPSGRS